MGLSTIRELVFDLSAFGGITVYLGAALFAAVYAPVLAVRLFVALVCCMVLVTLIRLAYFRQRPDRSALTHWYDRVTQSSFPSMHATRSAALFASIGLFSMSWPVWVLGVVLVASTCWTRVWLRRHYVSDVLVGVCVGALVAYAVGLLV